MVSQHSRLTGMSFGLPLSLHNVQREISDIVVRNTVKSGRSMKSCVLICSYLYVSPADTALMHSIFGSVSLDWVGELVDNGRSRPCNYDNYNLGN